MDIGCWVGARDTGGSAVARDLSAQFASLSLDNGRRANMLVQENQKPVESILYQGIIHLAVKAVPASGQGNELMTDLVSG